MGVDIATLAIEVKSDKVVTATDNLKGLSAAGSQAESATNKLTDQFDKLGYSSQSLTKYIEAAAAALALMAIVDKAKEAALLTARYDTLGIVMAVTGKNAAYTRTQMDEFQTSLQKTGISAIEARNGLIKMGQANIDMANVAKLARVAQDAAVVGNINSSEAFQRMMLGLSTGQSIVLHHLGLMTNFETAYIKGAAAVGKTTKELTETEKAQIRVNEVIRAGAGIQGAYEAAMTSVGKQLTSLPRYIQDLMVKVGEFGQGALFDGVTMLTNSLKWLIKNFEEVSAVASTIASAGALVGFGILTEKIQALVTAMNLAEMQGTALRMNTIYNAEASVSAAAAKTAEATALVRTNELRLASIDELAAEAKANFWASTVLRERILAEETLLALEQRRSIVVGELAAANVALTASSVTTATAVNALTVAELENSIAVRGAAAVTTVLGSAMQFVGGPIGLIAIAIAATTYEVVKFMERAESAQAKLAAMQSTGDFDKSVQKLREMESLIKEMENAKKSPDQKAAEATEANQKSINAAIKENVALIKQRTDLEAIGGKASGFWEFGELNKWDKLTSQINQNNKTIEYGSRITAETIAAETKLNALRKEMHKEATTVSTIDPEAQAKYDKQVMDAETALKKQYSENQKAAEDARLKDSLAQLQFSYDQKLISTQDYINKKYTLEQSAYQKELASAKEYQAQAQATLDNINANPDADRLMQLQAEQKLLAAKKTVELDIIKLSSLENSTLMERIKLMGDEAERVRLKTLMTDQYGLIQQQIDLEKKNGYGEQAFADQKVLDLAKLQTDYQQKILDYQKQINVATEEEGAILHRNMDIYTQLTTAAQNEINNRTYAPTASAASSATSSSSEGGLGWDANGNFSSGGISAIPFSGSTTSWSGAQASQSNATAQTASTNAQQAAAAAVQAANAAALTAQAAAYSMSQNLTVRALTVKGLTDEAAVQQLVNQQQNELTRAQKDGIDTVALLSVQQAEYNKLLHDQQIAKITKDTQTFFAVLKSSISTMTAAGNSLITSLTAAAAALRTASGALGATAAMTPSQQYEASRTDLTGVVQQAMSTGDATLYAKIPAMVTAFLDQSKAYNASGSQYTSDFGWAKNLLDGTATAAEQAAAHAVQVIAAATSQQVTLDNIQKLLTTGDPSGAMPGLLTELQNRNGVLNSAITATNTSLGTSGAIATQFTTAFAADSPIIKANNGVSTNVLSMSTALTTSLTGAGGVKEALTGSSTSSVSGWLSTVNNSASDTTTTISSLFVMLNGKNWSPTISPVINVTVSGTTSTTAPVAPAPAPTPTVTLLSFVRTPYSIEQKFQTGKTGKETDYWSNGTVTYKEYAKGGNYLGGSALMGERGPEFVDSSPGYVYRADETKALFDMAKRGATANNYNDSSELLAELKALRLEVQALRRQQSQEHAEDVDVAKQGAGKMAVAVGGNAAARIRY